jgi:hypothetical protein
MTNRWRFLITASAAMAPPFVRARTVAPNRTSPMRHIVTGAALSACLASGLILVTPLIAHEERQTLIAATKGKEFGIETYRVRQSGNGMRPSPTDVKQPTTTQTWAELLNGAGQAMGSLHLTMHWTRNATQR